MPSARPLEAHRAPGAPGAHHEIHVEGGVVRGRDEHPLARVGQREEEVVQEGGDPVADHEVACSHLKALQEGVAQQGGQHLLQPGVAGHPAMFEGAGCMMPTGMHVNFRWDGTLPSTGHHDDACIPLLLLSIPTPQNPHGVVHHPVRQGSGKGFLHPVRKGVGVQLVLGHGDEDVAFRVVLAPEGVQKHDLQ